MKRIMKILDVTLDIISILGLASFGMYVMLFGEFNTGVLLFIAAQANFLISEIPKK